ncbi:MAG TPA: hypothetical protein DF715_06545 [Oceanicaulis sp.]|jgi:uncharacterized membrane protein|nr:DUF1036 domain-containing protein [Glycocaulis albus]MBV5257222.1 DUF1036 domain-containing protein [Synechococcus moorigangaii CMS01]HCY55184.1 hypothetical protein [Oceanicaulis sp.]
MMRIVMVLAVLVLAGIFAPQARAGEVCNETSYYVDAAKAWGGQNGISAQGWQRIAPGSCVRFSGVPAGVPQFLYARTSEAYLGGPREWRGLTPVCVDRANFQIEGAEDCEAMGLEVREFRQLAPSERTRAVLVEPDDFGSRALEAGVQRLLQALGYEVRVVDGFAGRRSRAQIAAFERDTGASFGGNYERLVERLHTVALERNREVGLNVCNQTSGPAGIAIARQRNERWQSRGWWRIETGSCMRVVAERLQPGEVFLFAQTIDGERSEPLRRGVEAFCVAPGRFMSEGRSSCAERGYTQVMFRPSPVPVDGVARVTLEDADFEDLVQ